MTEKLNQIVQLFANSEAAETLKGAKTIEEAVAILAQYGIELTVEEFIEIGKQVTSDELSEDILMLVSGGGGFWRGVRDFFWGFLDGFKVW